MMCGAMLAANDRARIASEKNVPTFCLDHPKWVSMIRAIMNKNSVIELLSYDHISGYLYWKEPPRIGVKSGSKAGHLVKEGYVLIKFMGKMYCSHRLAWELFYGQEPPDAIDHINRDRSDNRISNLRLATTAQNNANKTARADSISGIKGVCRARVGPNWVARIKKDGKQRHIGTFETKEQASEAYFKELQKISGEFASQ